MKLGLLGGTFDPVHFGHLILAETARDQLGLGRLLFIPAGRPWRKEGRQIAPAPDRVAMLRLAIEGNPAFEISTIEVEHDGPSYTHLTLEQTAEAHPGVALFFVLGSDALLDLPNWKDPDRIMELATLVSADRPTGDGGDRNSTIPPGGSVVWLDMPAIEISATDIRERIAAGRSVRYLVPAAVEEYILGHGLYA